jgi:PDZ domain-containing protein
MSLFSTDSSGEPVRAPLTYRKQPKRVSIGWTLISIALILVVVMSLAPAPYVIEQPGPVFNTLGYDRAIGASDKHDEKPQTLITVPDRTTYPTSGALDLLTVQVAGTPEHLPSWLDVMSAWFAPSKAVIPVDVAFPPGTSTKEQQQQNAQEMTNSQHDAIAAALNQLGYDFPQKLEVAYVYPGSPADSVFEKGDQITAVNGSPVAGTQSLRDAIAKNGSHTAAKVSIVRDGKQQTVSLTPTTSSGQSILGVGVTMDYSFPFTVDIKLDDVGGPSAGQMFALGIIDKLTPGALNGGKKVAGTGTIDNEGNVGAIGGIRQKMYGAKDAGATYFLAPRANCDEVSGHVPDGLHVFAVKTLDDSLAVLDALREGTSTSQLPTCPAS